MAETGYFSQTATVGQISDKTLSKPVGSGIIAPTPSVPAAVFQATADTGPAPYYTKSSNTVLVLNFTGTPPFGSAESLIGIFWLDSSGVPHCCLDCTQSISTLAVTVTAPSTIPAGQTNFASVTAGTTQITASVSTQGSDIGNDAFVQNLDLVDYTIPVASLLQLLLSAGSTGAFELFATPVGTLSDSANGAWVESTKTLTPAAGPGWVAGALVGLPVTVNNVSVGTVVSNTTTALVTTANGSVSNGNYSWSIGFPNLVLTWDYTTNGDFYNWIEGDAAPYAGNVTKIRLYSSSMKPQTMSVGAILS